MPPPSPSTPQSRLSILATHLLPTATPSRCKVHILTGCSSPLGIGLAAAHALCAAPGTRAVYITDIQSTHLEEHAVKLREVGRGRVDLEWRVVDAKSEEGVRGVCEEVVGRWGRVDGFFANAGVVGGGKGVEELEVEDVEEVLRVNVLSVFLALKYAAKAMKVTSKEKPEPGGSIVATASVAGLRSGAGASDYSASKAAVISLIQTSAWQFRGTNIRANAVLPGLIETGMTAPMYDLARARGTEGKIGQLNPLQRGGRSGEVAAVAAFLLSDASSYVNGQAWAVDGGLSASLPVVPGKIG
ncbi:MAG: hypothetical protein M1814_006659 [Vezdaea aestivalis]|nr:MAG: hypothetical protein M1814_006659 [Vezdaea aestivalis]